MKAVPVGRRAKAHGRDSVAISAGHSRRHTPRVCSPKCLILFSRSRDSQSQNPVRFPVALPVTCYYLLIFSTPIPVLVTFT